MATNSKDPERYAVGTCAREAGVHVQTLHYYERRGLLMPRRRPGSGYRDYGPTDVRRVKAIKRAQSLGFTLNEIRELISLADRPARASRPPRRIAELAQAKLEEIDEKLRALKRMRLALRETLEACACGGDLSECQVLDGLADVRTRPDGSAAKRSATR